MNVFWKLTKLLNCTELRRNFNQISKHFHFFLIFFLKTTIVNSINFFITIYNNFICPLESITLISNLKIKYLKQWMTFVTITVSFNKSGDIMNWSSNAEQEQVLCFNWIKTLSKYKKIFIRWTTTDIFLLLSRKVTRDKT